MKKKSSALTSYKTRQISLINTNYEFLYEKQRVMYFAVNGVYSVSNGFSSISEGTTGAHGTGCNFLK